MIHFIFKFLSDSADTPFALALRDLGVAHRIFSGKLRSLHYRHRIQLIMFGLPRICLFAMRAVWWSLVKVKPRPDAVVVGSHLEALFFALGRRLLRRRVRIILLGFIYTRRNNRWLEQLRQTYFNWLFGRIDRVLCHSSLEISRYEALFPAAHGKFTYIPYGLHIEGADDSAPFLDPVTAPALSAGRSGRDYPLLFRVFADTGYPLQVVCDSQSALAGCISAPNIEVLRNCYDADYSRVLCQAGMVIVPLGVNDISAGQMVLIQAMAYRKPLIVTNTPTIVDYLQHEINALLVEPGNEVELRTAIDRLRNDLELARRLADNGYQAYQERHSMRAFVGNIVAAIDALDTM